MLVVPDSEIMEVVDAEVLDDDEVILNREEMVVGGEVIEDTVCVVI